jgi:hypothetical protein
MGLIVLLTATRPVVIQRSRLIAEEVPAMETAIMKSNHLRIVVLFCVGLLLFLTFAAAHASRIDPGDEFNGYEWQAWPTIGQEPRASCRAQKAVGWAVGGPVDGYGMILHTTDGGQHWERQGTSFDIRKETMTHTNRIFNGTDWAKSKRAQKDGCVTCLRYRE